jgi:pimeloyl-ACP methyl ester carboxylesterase
MPTRQLSTSATARPAMLLGAIAAATVLSSCGSMETARHSGAESQTVEEGFFPGAEGVQLFYRKVGIGSPPAVYLHGGPTSLADGGYSLDALAAGRTLIAFNQRSGGRSQLVDDPTRRSAEYYIRDLEALRQHFGITQMTLVGQSWGAMLAAMYAARYPEMVTRLLLLSPAPPATRFWPERQAKTAAAIGGPGVQRLRELEREMRTAPDEEVATLCKESVAIRFRAYLNDVSALRRLPVGYCDYAPAALRYELDAPRLLAMGDFDLLDGLAKLRQPVLVVEGADTKVPMNATRAWADAFPNGRLLLVPGASHLTWLEGDVPKLMIALNRFLAGEWPQGAQR